MIRLYLTIYAIILYYTILYYTILYYTILYYTMLCYARLYYTILYYTILYYTILYYTILYYTILYYTILYYTILYYTKIPRNTKMNHNESTVNPKSSLRFLPALYVIDPPASVAVDEQKGLRSWNEFLEEHHLTGPTRSFGNCKKYECETDWNIIRTYQQID